MDSKQDLENLAVHLVDEGDDGRVTLAADFNQAAGLRLNPVAMTREGFVELMNNLHLPPPAKIAEAVPANRACGKRS